MLNQDARGTEIEDPQTISEETSLSSQILVKEIREQSRKALVLDDGQMYEGVKRALDLVGAASLLLILSPVMCGVALGIKVSSPGAVCFSQTRLTQDGRYFQLLKFRSMVSDAEDSSGAVLAQRHDLRVTPFGRFIRMTRLDELPQLINVFRGDMSLIGPRPERPEIAEELQREIPRFYSRLRVKAGLTGLAQVIQGYPDGVRGYRRKVALDLLYIKKRSLLMDGWIAFRTIAVVLSGSGAR